MNKSPLDIEKDGFFKQTVVAVAANYYSRHPEVAAHDIAKGALRLTKALWNIILEERNEREASNSG